MKNHFYSRRSFLKTLGTVAAAAPFVTSGLMARSPNSTLRHASFGCGGMALGDLSVIGGCKGVEMVALCDVDLDRTLEARKLFPQARVYQDWRELLEKEAKNIDSVNVSTPDHMHAPIAVSAMHLGKHVYGQKPLAHDLHEVRRMTEIARQTKVVTQMGIQIQSSAPYRMGTRVVQEGRIGKIKEVHSWCFYNAWGDTEALPQKSDPVPANFNWDLWLGVCTVRPFIGNGYYHPGAWRKRLDFGGGTLGDMGCHIFDPVFKALDLAEPLSVRSEGPAPNQWNWAPDGKFFFRFAGTPRTASDILPVTWYDSAAKLPAEVLTLIEGDEVPRAGSLFIGTDGAMLLPHFARPTLYPKSKFHDGDLPDMGDVNHWKQFVSACRGEGTTTADFSYAGPLTETILIGDVASRFPQTTIQWNAKKMKFDLSEANQFIRREYRKGWSVKGLS